MKIYLNREPVSGPWGGGNKFVTALCSALERQKYQVVHKLEPGIDLIFCFDPRPNRYNERYIDLLIYKASNNIKIIQRVGDLGTHSKPELTKVVKKTLQHSDYFIIKKKVLSFIKY